MLYPLRILTGMATLLCTLSAVADDLPPAGYSLFDRLFSQAGADGYVYDVPYPFEALIGELETRLFTATDDEALVAVLIPRGRSLQREAAKPDYYRFPRVVVALDRESDQPLLTKHRLFLGYQEKAESIEVISYNETAGRFEFQVVSNYAAGKTPAVRYASRHLCLSCHQNEAAIYAKPLWRESNFNNKVADRIARYHPSYHGIVANAHKGNSGRFDQATDQSSLMQTYQRVWQDGCAVEDDDIESRACRAALFLAALQESLASMPRPEYRSALIENKLIPLLQRNWQRRWPRGLPVASADINDRDAPLNNEIDVLPPALDPTTLRPPLAHWTYRAAMWRAVRGIGKNFLHPQDLVGLNYLLVNQAELVRTRQTELSGNCRLAMPQGLAPGRWVNLDCQFANGADGNIQVEGEFKYISASADPLKSHQFLFTGQAGWARVAVDGTFVPHGDNGMRLAIDNAINPKLGRLWDNRRIAEFRLQAPTNERQQQVPARLTLSDDFGIIEQAVYRLLAQANAGRSDLFDRAPIQGLRLMRNLMAQLGSPLPPDGPRFLPVGLRQVQAAPLEQPAVNQLPPGSPVLLVYRYCASCHRDARQIPPGFLQGDSNQVDRQIRQCAPRIAYRLEMWLREARARSKSPMPPASFINASDATDWWRNSDDLRTLRRYVGQLIQDDSNVMDTPYEQLPPCQSAPTGLAEVD